MEQCLNPNGPDKSLNGYLHMLCVNSVGLFMHRLISCDESEILTDL